MSLAIIKRPRLLELKFELQPIEEETTIEIPFSYNMKHRISESDQSLLIVRFGVEGGGEDFPFNLKISTETRFHLEKGLEGKDVSKAVFLEAGPVIYPVLNEYFTDLGRKADLPFDALPDIDFQEFLESLEEPTEDDEEKDS